MASAADFNGASPVQLLPVEPSRVGLVDRASTRWVSLQRACEILGVNESTVRRWADAGEIQMFRTPGGHRRFDEAGLVQLLERGVRHPSRAVEPPQASRAHGPRRKRLSGTDRASIQAGREGDEREALWPVGYHLLQIVEDYLSPWYGGERKALSREVSDISAAYWDELRSRGVTLSQAVQAFTSVRRALDRTATQIAERDEMSPADTARAREEIAMLADRVLLALGTVYER